MFWKLIFLLGRTLKPLTCMAFGYMLLIMSMSEVMPMATPLTFTVAFFIPFMEKREFLTLALIQSIYTTVVILVYRDLLRTVFFGLDILCLLALLILIPAYTIIGDIKTVDTLTNIFTFKAPIAPSHTISIIGIPILFTACLIEYIITSMAIVYLLRTTGFYRRIGKICPKEWIFLERR